MQLVCYLRKHFLHAIWDYRIQFYSYNLKIEEILRHFYFNGFGKSFFSFPMERRKRACKYLLRFILLKINHGIFLSLKGRTVIRFYLWTLLIQLLCKALANFISFIEILNVEREKEKNPLMKIKMFFQLKKTSSWMYGES